MAMKSMYDGDGDDDDDDEGWTSCRKLELNSSDHPRTDCVDGEY